MQNMHGMQSNACCSKLCSSVPSCRCRYPFLPAVRQNVLECAAIKQNCKIRACKACSAARGYTAVYLQVQSHQRRVAFCNCECIASCWIQASPQCHYVSSELKTRCSYGTTASGKFPLTICDLCSMTNSIHNKRNVSSQNKSSCDWADTYELIFAPGMPLSARPPAARAAAVTLPAGLASGPAAASGSAQLLLKPNKYWKAG